jgi:hypothetical protein
MRVVLTLNEFIKDAGGVVKRWEITRGVVVNDYGIVSCFVLHVNCVLSVCL